MSSSATADAADVDGVVFDVDADVDVDGGDGSGGGDIDAVGESNITTAATKQACWLSTWKMAM